MDGDEHQDIEGVAMGHDCMWETLARELAGQAGSLLSPARTIVLLRCRICGLPIAQTLAGRWTMEQLMETR